MADRELNPLDPFAEVDLAGPAPAPGVGEVLGAARQRGRVQWNVLGALAPFTIYTFIFLIAPALVIIWYAFQKDKGGLTLSNFHDAFTGVYLKGFEQSIELAVITAVVGGLCGVFLANAVHTARRPFLKRVVSTASGVFANFGGLPLAFLFIAGFGSTGLVTAWLGDIGITINSEFLFGLTGIAIVYLYFQIPLMVLVITPALEGLRPNWREAADNLGASSWQYWRYVGAPVLGPSVLGGMLLLFGSSLSAYATAQALTSGIVALTPIQIGTFVNGNVVPGEANVGKALGVGLILVIMVVIAIYIQIQRKASQWLR